MCVALVVLLVAAVLLIPALARIVGAAVIILVVVGLALAIAEERRIETPSQYRGVWCETKWQTVHRRCKESDSGWQLTIDRYTVMTEETTCKPSAVRRGSGEHRVWLTCQSDSGDYKTQQRWRLGTNRTRLQIIDRFDEPPP
jgi:hypothetical protein